MYIIYFSFFKSWLYLFTVFVYNKIIVHLPPVIHCGVSVACVRVVFCSLKMNTIWWWCSWCWSLLTVARWTVSPVLEWLESVICWWAIGHSVAANKWLTSVFSFRVVWSYIIKARRQIEDCLRPSQKCTLRDKIQHRE